MLNNINFSKIQSFVSVLNNISDFRKPNHLLKHKLGNVLLIMILAIMSNYTSQRGMEEFSRNNAEVLKENLNITKLPTKSLFNRVCNNLDYVKFWLSLKEWLENTLKTNNIVPSIIAIDGKILQGTIDNLTHNTPNQNMISIVSAYEHNLGLVLHQADMEGKKISETVVFRNMIKDLKEKVKDREITITGDALHSSQVTVKLFQELKLNYVLGVKGNNKLLREQLQEKTIFKEKYTYCDKRFKREVLIFKVPIDFKVLKIYSKTKTKTAIKYEAWQYLNFKTFIQVTRTNFKTQKIQNGFYISNMEETVLKFAEIIQGHWSIENKLHWQKDVVFKEDSHKTKNHNSAKVFSILITATINLFRLNGYQSMQKATRKYCNRVADCLRLLEFDKV